MSKGYLIDPETRTVSVVDVCDWKHMNELIGSRLFCLGWTFKNGDTLYVDDEGIFKANLFTFNLRDRPEPLIGKGLLLGTDDCGNSTDPITPYVEFINEVYFDPQFKTTRSYGVFSKKCN